ncbi:MAG: hypothetical protein Q8K81_04345, partial [Sulfuricurvum sp.]|nr:hypothetical protein [Sulfuricurvum sp.]
MKLLSLFRRWLYPPITPNIPKYGKGVHALPNPKEHELFDQASNAFIAGERIKGYEYFLLSLTHRSGSKHLTYSIHDNQLTFELLQGAAIIRGVVTDDALDATAIIVNAQELHVALKRRLLEQNFQLTYARFCSQNGVITLKLHLDNATITPQKIFFPLREIALNADFEKEMIAGEFETIALLEYDHLRSLTTKQYAQLHGWMHTWIDQTKKSLIGLLSNDNTGMA